MPTDPAIIPLGPWPSGINNVQRASHAVFQLPGKDHLPSLVEALDLDLDDQGWLRTRRGATLEQPTTQAVGLWSLSSGDTLLQIAGDLYQNDTLIASGLGTRVSLCEHWGRVYVTDGRKALESDGITVQPWGLPIPTLSATALPGSLSLGRYLLQATFSDATGNEGGTSDVVAVLGTGLQIHVAGATPAVAAVNLYLSQPDQLYTSFCRQIPLELLPFTVIDPSLLSVGDPPKTEQMIGPIRDAQGLCSYRAFLLMWRDNVAFRSEAGEPHLFQADNILQFPSPITAMEGTASGLWVGTTTGLWFVTGEESSNWIPLRKTHEPVCRGSHRLQASKLPALKLADQRLALFISASGLLACTEDGGVIPITDGRYAFDVNKAYRFAYAEHDDLKQLCIAGVADD